MAIPKVLLFDLGGVLVDFAGLQELPRLLATPMNPQDLRRKWANSPAVGLFETGRCSEREFAATFIEEWGLALGSDEFLDEFRLWVRAPYPETAELIGGLRGRYTLACFSNTNATHWGRVLQMHALGPVRDHPFLSYQLGLMKPSREAFAQVVRRLGCEPAEIAVFDDGAQNVDGAAMAGLSAHQTVGPVALRNALQGLGLL